MLNREFDGRFKKGVHASPNTEFKKGGHWRPHAVFREKNYLLNEYVKKQKSALEISLVHGVTENTIYFWIAKHKIPTRSMSENRRIKKWGLFGKANGMYGRCGDKSPRWIDGSSPLRQSMYARCFWKELKKEIYKRDNYRCVRCNSPHKSSSRLHAHHIKTWAGNPNSRFDLKNIVTLCQNCHNFIHSKGNINNEFLS